MTSNPDAVTESNDTASPMIHLLGAGAGLDAYDEKDTIPTMLLSQSADPPREFLDCRTPLENPDADLSACLWSREALLHTSLNSDSDELCFSDYSLSSTHTVRVREDARAQASRSFVYTSTKPAMRAPTSNERHWWLAKPVGRNSLCHLDPTGTRTPNSAESSSVALTHYSDEPDHMALLPRVEEPAKVPIPPGDEPDYKALPLWNGDLSTARLRNPPACSTNKALLRPGDEPTMALPPRRDEPVAGHDHFLLEILDDDHTPYGVIIGPSSDPLGCCKWVAGHAGVTFNVRLTIAPAAWRNLRCDSLTAVLRVDDHRPSCSELWRPLSPHTKGVYMWHENAFGDNPQSQDGLISLNLWAGAPKELVATRSRKYNTIRTLEQRGVLRPDTQTEHRVFFPTRRWKDQQPHSEHPANRVLKDAVKIVRKEAPAPVPKSRNLPITPTRVVRLIKVQPVTLPKKRTHRG